MQKGPVLNCFSNNHVPGFEGALGGGRRPWSDCFKQNQKPKWSSAILCCCVSVESNLFDFFFLKEMKQNDPNKQKRFKKMKKNFFSYLSDYFSFLSTFRE